MKKRIKTKWWRVEEPSSLGCWSRSCVTFKLCSQRGLTLAALSFYFFLISPLSLSLSPGRPRAQATTRPERKEEVPPTRENVPTKERQVLEGCGPATHMRARLCVSRCDDAWTRVYQERRTLARPGVLYDESPRHGTRQLSRETRNLWRTLPFWESRSRFGDRASSDFNLWKISCIFFRTDNFVSPCSLKFLKRHQFRNRHTRWHLVQSVFVKF